MTRSKGVSSSPQSAAVSLSPSLPASRAAGEVVLAVEGVVKHYGARRVLDGVSFTVRAGERVALTGPSGSGKTTLLNCLGGIDRPDAGSLTLRGERIDRLGPDALARLRRERVGTVFQFFHLLPTLSAAENVELPLQLLGVPPAERGVRVAGEVVLAVEGVVKHYGARRVLDGVSFTVRAGGGRGGRAARRVIFLASCGRCGA